MSQPYQQVSKDASQAIVHYKPGSRRHRLAAAKWWQDGSIEYVTLYTADGQLFVAEGMSADMRRCEDVRHVGSNVPYNRRKQRAAILA